MKYERGKCYKLLVGTEAKGKPFKYSGDYVVIECEEASDMYLKGTVIGHSPEIGNFSSVIRIGCSIKHEKDKDIWMVAESRESYFANPANIPVKIVEKEVIKEVEVEKIVRVQIYDETLLDKLYNWYCKQMKRNDDETV